MNRLLTLILFLALSVLTMAGAKPKNVLFIICDDLNTHVSTSGYEAIHTPALDKLAKEAMTLSQAFCQYPVCGPSRASLLSGLYPESTGVLDNELDIRQTRPGTVSLPQHFKQNGYWTAATGKVFHNEKADHGEVAWSDGRPWFTNDELPVVTKARQAFEQEHGSVDQPQHRQAWRTVMKAVQDPLTAQTPPGHGPSGLRDDQHMDGKNVRLVASWLKERSFGDKPFFIALGIQKPHVPFLAPDKYFDLYPREKIAFYRDRPDLWDSIPRDAIDGRFREFGFELGVENAERRQKFMQAYHACVSFIDAQIAIVLKQLKDEGLYDDTIIVLTSDHGYHLGDHFLWGKVTLFDIGARVPLIIRVPGMTAAGSRSDAMVELVDLYPTLSELAGLKAPADLQGMSLVPLLSGDPNTAVREYAYSVVSRGKHLGRSVRNQDWRYAKWPRGEELYDRSKDPHERKNLANDPEYQEHLKKLRAALAERQKAAPIRRSKKVATVTPPDPNRELALAYYYPWYLKDDWSRHGYQGTPQLGKYGTDDPAVVEQHIKWGEQAGLDGFVVSWWGPDELTDRHFRSGYLNARNVDRMKFAFIYECLGRLDKADGKNDSRIDFASPDVHAQWLKDFEYLRDNYFSHPSYLKIGERPMVILYVSRTFRNFNASHLSSLEEKLGVDLFLIADEPFIGRQKNPQTAENGLRGGKALFDAYTAYNMFENANVREGESAYAYMEREAMPIYRAWSEQTVFCPGIVPRYHDFRGHKPLVGTPEEYVRMIRDARALPCKPVGDGIDRIYLITSFNEWWEGSTIEPATEYGTSFLEATRQGFGR